MANRTNKILANASKTKEQRREHLLKLLDSTEPIWEAESYEQSTNSTDWVKAIRKQSDNRLQLVQD